MTLSNEDKALIKETSDLLKQLKTLLNKVDKFICEPIDTTEGEQEQGKEWKEGDWVKWGDKLGIIAFAMTKIQFHYNINCQNGKTYIVCKNEFIKPNDKEIETHLVAIAENKYPVGTKFKDGNDKQFEISETEFDYDNRGNALFGRCYEFSGWIRIWHNGKWAEIVAPIETEETKEFTYNTFVQHDSIDGYSVLITVNTQSKETAYKKLDAIKQYLSTNKF